MLPVESPRRQSTILLDRSLRTSADLVRARRSHTMSDRVRTVVVAAIIGMVVIGLVLSSFQTTV
jgi:hypothetical protein